LQHWHILMTPNDYDKHACFDETLPSNSNYSPA
jgi:hypothetical protein